MMTRVGHFLTENQEKSRRTEQKCRFFVFQFGFGHQEVSVEVCLHRRTTQGLAQQSNNNMAQHALPLPTLSLPVLEHL
jgi:hypothetical protein